MRALEFVHSRSRERTATNSCLVLLDPSCTFQRLQVRCRQAVGALLTVLWKTNSTNLMKNHVSAPQPQQLQENHCARLQNLTPMQIPRKARQKQCSYIPGPLHGPKRSISLSSAAVASSLAANVPMPAWLSPCRMAESMARPMGRPTSRHSLSCGLAKGPSPRTRAGHWA